MLPFKQCLAAGERVAMVNVGGRNPDMIKVLARHEANAVFIDGERSGIGIDGSAELLFAAQASGLPSLVRSHSAEPAELIRYLDRGADGLVVPHCKSPEDVMAAVEVMRFAFGEAADGKLLIIQIETQGAVASLEEIISIPGVDAFLIGPNDLAWELCGQRGARSAEITQVIDDICDKLNKAGRRYGMPCPLNEASIFQERGCTLAYYSIDWLIETGMQVLRQQVGLGTRV